jgi:predicted O-linked N-acetylglucosamine transferase (SPINDLY family)
MLKSLLVSLWGGRREAPPGDIDRAIASFRAGRLDDASDEAQRILRADPDHARAWNLLGGIAIERGDERAAAQYFENAAALAPQDAVIVTNLAECRRRTGDLDGAETLARSVLQVDSSEPAATHTLALILTAQGRGEEAFQYCQRLVSLDPDFEPGRAAYLFLLQLVEVLNPGQITSEHIRLARRIVVPERWRAPRHTNSADPERPLRIGYVSADFCRHAASYFIEPVLSGHDHERFATVCYSGVAQPDEVTERLRGLAGSWREVARISDESLAELVRDDGIDILVDLSGHTRGNRLGVFARKPAPLQLTWFGYPGTTGLEGMDYRITDALCDPPGESESFYTEKLLRLPDIMYCYQPPADMPPVTEAPAVRKGYVTFGAVNGASKLTPRWIALWAQLLAEVPGSRLIVAAMPAGAAQERVRRMIVEQGIDPSRVVIRERMPYAQFWALHGEIDLALDTYPCNGGTTTCETAWLGVPVVTISGERYGGNRLGTSMLTSMGLGHLVARTPAEYVAIARRLATDIAQLAALRETVRERMRASPITDRSRFMGNLERCFRDIWRQWCAGQVR